MKTLKLYARGTYYTVSLEAETLGHIIKSGQSYFNLPHPTWKILGFAQSWNANRITIPLTCDFNLDNFNPKRPVYVFDLDHNTLRQWGKSLKVRSFTVN